MASGLVPNTIKTFFFFTNENFYKVGNENSWQSTVGSWQSLVNCWVLSWDRFLTPCRNEGGRLVYPIAISEFFEDTGEIKHYFVVAIG